MVLTLLVENHDVATGKVDGVGGRQTRNCNGERQQIDGQTRISSRCRASARFVREDEKEQRHKEQAGDEAIWGYLRPPPTTITLGAIIVTCESFEGVDEGRKKDGTRRKRKGGIQMDGEKGKRMENEKRKRREPGPDRGSSLEFKNKGMDGHELHAEGGSEPRQPWGG